MRMNRRLNVLAALVCALAGAPLASFSAVAEQQMTTETLADFEFDSARDGTFCASCNFGAGNARIAYVDQQFRVMVAPINRTTGQLLTSQATQIDINAAFVTDYGNGPGWMFSQRGSELVYTRFKDGKPRKDLWAGVALARQTGPTSWTADFIPGGIGRVSPKGTQDNTDPVPLLSYGNVSKPFAYWRKADVRSKEVVLPGDDSVRGVGLRWVPGTREILLSFVPQGEVDNQIFVHDTQTGLTEQISTGPGYKRAQFMSYPPEFGGDAVMFTVVDDTRFDVYRRQTAGGVTSWSLSHVMNMPADQPFVSGSPEAFTHNGRTWIVLALRATKGANVASNLGIAALDPSRPELRMLTDASSPSKWRSDPEYFIADDSVYIYFTRAEPLIFPTIGDGVWRVDTGLGPRIP